MLAALDDGPRAGLLDERGGSVAHVPSASGYAFADYVVRSAGASHPAHGVDRRVAPLELHTERVLHALAIEREPDRTQGGIEILH